LNGEPLAFGISFSKPDNRVLDEVEIKRGALLEVKLNDGYY
jgi:hypothetical protein